MASRKIFSVEEDLAEALSEYWHAKRLRSEGAAIRQILRIVLEAEGFLKAKPKKSKR